MLRQPSTSTRSPDCLDFRSDPTRSGFTLIELLVVIAIIGLLISLLVPSLSNVRATTAKIGCASNMNQIGVAMLAYAADNDGKFPTSHRVYSGSGFGILGWDDQLAPYDGRGALTDEVAAIPFLDPGNYSGENAHLYRCPATPYKDTAPGFRISYVAHATTPRNPATGERLFGAYTRGIIANGVERDGEMEWISDSLKTYEVPNPAHSILMFEWHVYYHDMGSGPVSWLQRLQAAHADSLNTSWFPSLKDQWVHGKLYKMNFLFADGSVRFLHMQETVEPGRAWYSDPSEVGNGMWECQTVPEWYNN